MRLYYVVVLLVVINGLMLIWQFLRPEPAKVDVPATDYGTQKLILYDEYKKEQQSTTQENNESNSGGANEGGANEGDAEPVIQTAVNESTKAVPEGTAICYSVGPLKTENLAQQVQKQLSVAQIGTVTIRGGSSASQYWVFTPPHASYAAAQTVAAELKAKQIKDFQILVSAGKQNAISLGLYTDRRAAQRRMAKLESLGFQVQMDEIKRGVKQYWLDYPANGENPLPNSVFEELKKEYPALQLDKREGAC